MLVDYLPLFLRQNIFNSHWRNIIVNLHPRMYNYDSQYIKRQKKLESLNNSLNI